MKEMTNRNLISAGGESHGIGKKNNVKLQIDYGEIKVTDILYSLSITRNLLSIGYLADDGKAILFTNNHVYILENIIFFENSHNLAQSLKKQIV